MGRSMINYAKLGLFSDIPIFLGKKTYGVILSNAKELNASTYFFDVFSDSSLRSE